MKISWKNMVLRPRLQRTSDQKLETGDQTTTLQLIRQALKLPVNASFER